MSLKKLHQQVNKIIETPEWSYEEMNRFFNQATERLERFCIIPNCHAELKNYRGVRIHLAKTHHLSLKNLRLNSHVE